MSAATGSSTSERDAVRQYADWYAEQGYEVLVAPAARDLPEFLRPFAVDLIARRDGENVVVEIRTPSSASFEKIQHLSRALEHRAGWKLQVVYADIPDPEWEPPSELPGILSLLARLETLPVLDRDDDRGRSNFLFLWSIIEAAARHRLASHKISPTARISSSALIKSLLHEGIIEEDAYAVLRRGLAMRNAIAHGFLNQPIDAALFEELRKRARRLLPARSRVPIS